MDIWTEYNFKIGKHTGNNLHFSKGITLEYFLNIKESGWIMDESGRICMNPNKDMAWHKRETAAEAAEELSKRQEQERFDALTVFDARTVISKVVFHLESNAESIARKLHQYKRNLTLDNLLANTDFDLLEKDIAGWQEAQYEIEVRNFVHKHARYFPYPAPGRDKFMKNDALEKARTVISKVLQHLESRAKNLNQYYQYKYLQTLTLDTLIANTDFDLLEKDLAKWQAEQYEIEVSYFVSAHAINDDPEIEPRD